MKNHGTVCEDSVKASAIQPHGHGAMNNLLLPITASTDCLVSLDDADLKDLGKANTCVFLLNVAFDHLSQFVASLCTRLLALQRVIFGSSCLGMLLSTCQLNVGLSSPNGQLLRQRQTHVCSN